MGVDVVVMVRKDVWKEKVIDDWWGKKLACGLFYFIDGRRFYHLEDIVKFVSNYEYEINFILTKGEWENAKQKGFLRVDVHAILKRAIDEITVEDTEDMTIQDKFELLAEVVEEEKITMLIDEAFNHFGDNLIFIADDCVEKIKEYKKKGFVSLETLIWGNTDGNDNC